MPSLPGDNATRATSSRTSFEPLPSEICSASDAEMSRERLLQPIATAVRIARQRRRGTRDRGVPAGPGRADSRCSRALMHVGDARVRAAAPRSAPAGLIGLQRQDVAIAPTGRRTASYDVLRIRAERFHLHRHGAHVLQNGFDLRADSWPSKSMKNTYVQLPVRDGRVSMRVRLMPCRVERLQHAIQRAAVRCASTPESTTCRGRSARPSAVRSRESGSCCPG